MRTLKALGAGLLAICLLASCSDDPEVDTGAGDGQADDGDGISEAPDGSGVEVPDRAPDLVGTITSVEPFVPVTEDCTPPEDLDPDAAVSSDDPPVCTPEDGDVVGTILVEGDVAPQQGRKISYTVTSETAITGETADGTKVGVFGDLVEGQVADTWTTGSCAESYPEQCTLEAIRVTG